MITPKITNLGYSNLWTDMSTILGYQTNLDQYISKLFANNEQGFFYDPNDLTTMFQDAAGTVPVTGVGQTVGLMLDKSKGLVMGSELIITLDLTTWATVGSPEVTKNTFTTAAPGGVRLDGVLQNGTWYKCIMELDSTVGVQLYNGQQVVTLSGTGRRTITLYYKASASGFYFRNSGAGTTTIYSLSIKSVAGNHAYQNQSAMRPLLVASPQRLDYDTVDDNLITNLPAQITDCTVIRSVPNIGTQILTNQTIPATYNDNTDHCGLIVINRALTATETSQITQLFDKAAGV